ncbi:MAG: DNA-3-methyladenine glycosylase, partial [bacterium]
TETEAYPSSDPTSHAYERKPTIRTAIQYKNGGYLYEYLIMGLYTITSIVTGNQGEADVSFIRSVEPIEGVKTMRERRKYFGKNLKRIASGPGLLSQALGLTPKDNCMYICDKNSEIKIFKPSLNDFKIGTGTRINLGTNRAKTKEEATQSINQPWRFYIKGSNFLS